MDTHPFVANQIAISPFLGGEISRLLLHTMYAQPILNVLCKHADLRFIACGTLLPYAGRRTDFRDKNRELFSGQLFSGELFSGAALLPENFVPINVCGVDSFSPN